MPSAGAPFAPTLYGSTAVPSPSCQSVEGYSRVRRPRPTTCNRAAAVTGERARAARGTSKDAGELAAVTLHSTDEGAVTSSPTFRSTRRTAPPGQTSQLRKPLDRNTEQRRCRCRSRGICDGTLLDLIWPQDRSSRRRMRIVNGRFIPVRLAVHRKRNVNRRSRRVIHRRRGFPKLSPESSIAAARFLVGGVGPSDCEHDIGCD